MEDADREKIGPRPIRKQSKGLKCGKKHVEGKRQMA